MTAGALRVAALAALVAACLGGAGAAQAAPTLPPGFQDSLVTPVDRATSSAFVPGGRMLIARVRGVVRVFKDGAGLIHSVRRA